MKITLPEINETDAAEPAAMLKKLREVFQRIEQAFQKIRIDDAIIIGGGMPIRKHQTATATWNPANVGAGAQVTTTVTVAGAALGDEVTCSFNKDLQGMQLTGYVSAADTITLVLFNGTAGGINLAEGELRASYWRH